MTKHIYNLKKDPKDPRDKHFCHHYGISKSLPKSKDLRKHMPAIEDQEELGSCTANALAGNLEYLYLKKQDQFQAARLFIYYNERALINEIYEDSGAYLRDGIKSLAKWGVCSEAMWPYDIGRYTTKPGLDCYAEALTRQITQYLRISTIQEMKQCLADGYPFVFGINVYESFESEHVAKTGTVPIPKSDEEQLGGHAMLCVGYNDHTKRFIVRNSWGTGWGAKGYCTLPYEYLVNESDDLWTIKVTE